MPMKLIETTIDQDSVAMEFADNPDFEEAKEWIEFQLPLSDLKMADGQTPMSDLAMKRLVTIQLAALHVVRDAIDEEIQRLSNLLSATR
jgi:hypothetical protein